MLIDHGELHVSQVCDDGDAGDDDGGDVVVNIDDDDGDDDGGDICGEY